MTRLILSALLGVSVAINVWLLLPKRSQPGSRPAAPATAASAHAASSPAGSPATSAAAPAVSANSASTPAAGGSPAPRGFKWKKRPATDDDFRQLAADLRAAGFPPRVIARLVSELYRQHAVASSPLGSAPYWQSQAAILSTEGRSLFRELPARIAALLGPEFSPALLVTAVERQRRYGPLPDAKVDALVALERDYYDMSTDVYLNRSGTVDSEAYRAMEKQRLLLETEKLADLARVLTPEELQEYQHRNSPAARIVASLVADLPLTAAQFAALTDAREAYETAVRPAATASATLGPQHFAAAQTAYYDRARAVLPEESFYPFLEESDTTYRTLARLREQFPAVSSAATYAAWQLNSEFSRARIALLGSRPSAEQVAAQSADFNARLDRTLGPEAAAAFRQTPMGRSFAPPTPRPAPAAAPASPRN